MNGSNLLVCCNTLTTIPTPRGNAALFVSREQLPLRGRNPSETPKLACLKKGKMGDDGGGSGSGVLSATLNDLASNKVGERDKALKRLREWMGADSNQQALLAPGGYSQSRVRVVASWQGGFLKGQLPVQGLRPSPSPHPAPMWPTRCSTHDCKQSNFLILCGGSSKSVVGTAA